MSQQPGYLPQGPNRALSPWTVEQNRLLDSWIEITGAGAGRSAISREQFNEDLLDHYSMGYEDQQYDYDDVYDDGGGNDFEDWTGMPS